ncbi:hypothetical protein ACOSP7_027511 [Xanthoceras sorbifolium]
MSDHQKGGLAALRKEWPKAINRYCFRHILANFKCVFKNHNLNGKLWHTTRVGSAADFKESLKWVGEDFVNVVNWLMSKPVEKWARHAFDYRIKSDLVTNNMDKPILTLLELLRRKIIVRFSEKWDELEKWNDSITSYAREHLMMNEKEARKLEVMHGRGEWYETLEPYGKCFLVNTSDVHCNCGMWQISGIPCMHVVTVFMYNRQFAHEHVHWYYSKETIKLTYARSINPISDESRWPEIEHDDGNTNEVIKPPQKRTKVGRPKKARRRATNEPRAPTKIFSNKCKDATLSYITFVLVRIRKMKKGKEKYQARTDKKKGSSNLIHINQTQAMYLNNNHKLHNYPVFPSLHQHMYLILNNYKTQSSPPPPPPPPTPYIINFFII